jgi:ParB-like chromosome segregation protein Spo0J
MTTYKVQIDDLVRDATADEIAEIEAREAAEQLRIETIEAKAAARQAVLDKLGLTADEVAALLS